MSFKNLNLLPNLLKAVAECGFNQPTDIQCQAIPVVLSGSDLMASAQTGTGKTASFALPLLQRLMSLDRPQKGYRAIRALVLAPTRELAAQIEQSIHNYGRYLPLRCGVVFGGVGIGGQKQKLRHGIDILVATPGRLLDHINQNTVDLSFIEMLVLDEADRMLDMGFIHDVRKILTCVPRQKQTAMFSATFSKEVKRLASDLLQSPALIETTRCSIDAESVNQVVHPVDKSRKRKLLSHLINSNNWRQVLVFSRTKHGADHLSRQLSNEGITTAALHGNKSQGARTRALADFKSGRVRVLIATDIAARGLDIDQLPHVVNFDLPNVAEDYVHRIGRTGRAGKNGQALSLVCVDESRLLRDIERLLKREIPKVLINDFEPDPAAQPKATGRKQSRQKQNKVNPFVKKTSDSRGHSQPSGKHRPNKQHGKPSHPHTESNMVAALLS